MGDKRVVILALSILVACLLYERFRGPQLPGMRMNLPDDLIALDWKRPSVGSLAEGSRQARQHQEERARELKLPVEVSSRAVGMRFRFIPAGSFITQEDEDGPFSRGVKAGEQIVIKEPFFCGTFEVTRSEWFRALPNLSTNEYSSSYNNRYHFPTGQCPVGKITCEECLEFLQAMCELEGVPEGTYELLSEKEWEYACRAGTKTPIYTGELSKGKRMESGYRVVRELEPVAWYEGNSGGGWFDLGDWGNHHAHEVGQKKPNAFGLYDMLGNVEEICSDRYENIKVTNKDGEEEYLVCRKVCGGSFMDEEFRCRAAGSSSGGGLPEQKPEHAYATIGFRVKRVIPKRSCEPEASEVHSDDSKIFE